MTLDEIAWMNTLFETGNMTKAAEALFVSQPALSQCLRRIEEQLGFPLFTRSNKGLVPTERGLLFAESARVITDTYRDFLIKARLSVQTALTNIIIGLPPFLSACCSAEIIQQLGEVCPDIRFSIHEGSWDMLLAALRNNEIHLAATTGPLKLEGIKIHTFGHGKLVIMLRRGSPVEKHVVTEEGRRILDPVYLAGEPLAMTKPGQATRRLSEDLMREAGISPQIQQETRHVETLYRYAEKGIATAISPLMADAFERDRENRLICEVPSRYRSASLCGCIAALPDVDRLIPSSVLQVIENNILNSSSYLMQIP